MKTKKKIEILLLPSDFKRSDYTNPSNCPLAKATKRHFKFEKDYLGVTPSYVYINGQMYNIKDSFGGADYQYVKDEYEKDPKMLKAQYVVTLIPID